MMKSQQRGPITDTWPVEGDLAVCECVHGKTWPEGDWKEPQGSACAECVEAWSESPEALRMRFGPHRYEIFENRSVGMVLVGATDSLNLARHIAQESMEIYDSLTDEMVP